MKKGLLLIAAIIFIAFNSNAQIFSEDFEATGLTSGDDFVLTDWTNVATTGTRVWQYKEYTDADDITYKYIQASSYGSGEVNETWVVTPAIDLADFTETSFTFDVKIGYWKHAGLTIQISTDFTGDVTTATWTDVTSNFTIPTEPTDGYGESVSAGTMDLTSYSGIIYIAFKYNGDDGAGETTTFQIDNISVTDGTTNVENTNSITKLFPNPATTVLNIASEVSISNISVSNVIGQKVLNVNSINANNYKLNLENLSKGVYLINVNNVDGTSAVTKFVKK